MGVWLFIGVISSLTDLSSSSASALYVAIRFGLPFLHLLPLCSRFQTFHSDGICHLFPASIVTTQLKALTPISLCTRDWLSPQDFENALLYPNHTRALSNLVWLLVYEKYKFNTRTSLTWLQDNRLEIVWCLQ